MGNCDDIKDRVYNISHGHGDCFKPKKNAELNFQFIITEKEEDIYRAQCDIETLKKEKLVLQKERDAAIADLTELCMFYKTQTICNFCAYDDDEDCKGRGSDNDYMNKCFKWRGPT